MAHKAPITHKISNFEIANCDCYCLLYGTLKLSSNSLVAPIRKKTMKIETSDFNAINA